MINPFISRFYASSLAGSRQDHEKGVNNADYRLGFSLYRHATQTALFGAITDGGELWHISDTSPN
jgi:hypothetical protein